MTAFLVVSAFGVGVIATAAYDGSNPFGSPAEEGAASGGPVIEVELGDLYIKPAQLTAAAGPLTIAVHNAGQIEHNFSLGNLGATDMLAPGEEARLTIASVERGEYEFICEVAGHAGAGMKGTLIVGGSDAGAGSASQPDMTEMSAEEMVEHDAAVTASFPAETKGKGGRLLKPELVDRVKVFELTADEIEWEVEPGKVVEAMAYNGQIPGPTIRANVGDRVRIVLHNKLEQPTTLHYHGLLVPNDQDGVPAITQDAIMPGESFTYEFTIRNSGTHMYHPHFNAQDQVVKGLLGAFLVADSADPRVDVDQAIVINDGPLGFTLNGKGFPAITPIVAELGDVVRIRYLNEGFQTHPMHLHGLTQRVIAKDGYMLDRP